MIFSVFQKNRVLGYSWSTLLWHWRYYLHWSRDTLSPVLGAYYNWPKFKYQLLSGTGWFSYKIWTKNSKTPIVNPLKNLRSFQKYIFKIQWEIIFLTFLNIGRNTSTKKLRIEIWTFLFQICFRNQFWTSGSDQTENTQIHVFAYFPFGHFPKSKIDSESRFEMRMSIFLF